MTNLRTEAEPGEHHLHLLGARVLRLVEDDEAVVEGAAAHVRERRDLDGAALEQRCGLLGVHHVVERVVERAQVRIDLLGERAGQEAERLARFDRRTREDDAADLLALERLDGHRHREVGLAGTGRADAEGDGVLADRVDVALLTCGLGPDRLALVGEDDVAVQRGGADVAVPHELDGALERLRRQVLAALDELDHLGEERRDGLRVVAAA